MFSLAKLAYLACTEDEREQYYSDPNNVTYIDVGDCCHFLLNFVKENNSLVPTNWKYEDVCVIAAGLGDIDCLAAAQRFGFTWNEDTCSEAAANGQLELLKYAFENGCPWDEDTTRMALEFEHMDCFKFARENGCPYNENDRYTRLLNRHGM